MVYKQQNALWRVRSADKTTKCRQLCILGAKIKGHMEKQETEIGNRNGNKNTPITGVASSPGHSQILSRSLGEKSGEGLVPLLRHGLEMVDLVST